MAPRGCVKAKGSPKHFFTQLHWTFLMFPSASEGFLVSLPSGPTSISITPSCPAFSEAQKDQNGSALVSSAKQKILIPPDFWAQQLSGTFTHVKSRYCNKDIMPLGEGLSLPELPQACLPLVWNKIIKILYTFLEILPNLNLPRCHHLNADCRTSSEVHWI